MQRLALEVFCCRVVFLSGQVGLSIPENGYRGTNTGFGHCGLAWERPVWKDLDDDMRK